MQIAIRSESYRPVEQEKSKRRSSNLGRRMRMGTVLAMVPFESLSTIRDFPVKSRMVDRLSNGIGFQGSIIHKSITWICTTGAFVG